MSRRSAEETRRLLLGTALDLLHEHGPSAGVRHIRLSEVVRRAGRTTGAAYRLWDDQEAFHHELAIVAVQWRDRGSTVKTIEQIQPVLESNGPLEEVIRRGAEANLLKFPDDLVFFTTLALRVSAYGHPELEEASRRRHVEAMAAYGELYTAVLSIYRRRFKPPFEMGHLTASFAALAEGFGIQIVCGVPHPTVDLPSSDGRVGNEWTLFGVAALALLNRMTEPLDADGDRPLPVGLISREGEAS